MKTLIIGGAEITQPYDVAEYDLVVRVNMGISEGDCDVWVWGGSTRLLNKKETKFTSYKNLICGNKYKEVLRVDARPINATNCFEDTLDISRSITPEEYLRLFTKYFGKKEGLLKPTSGLMTIFYYVDMGYDVSIIGFDGYATPNRLTGCTLRKTRVHDGEKERAVVDSLLSAGSLKRLGSSPH